MSGHVMHELAARLACGEEAAFAELYDSCADQLHGYLAVRLGSHDAASDVLQATFLRAVKSRRRFRGVENPVAYLFQIARNEAARAAKREAVEQAARLSNRLTHRPAAGATEMMSEVFAADERRGQQEDAEVVALALARLPIEVREVIELKIYAGLTFREIADVVGMPQGTVATQYRRGLESLRGWLERQLR